MTPKSAREIPNLAKRGFLRNPREITNYVLTAQRFSTGFPPFRFIHWSDSYRIHCAGNASMPDPYWCYFYEFSRISEIFGKKLTA